jgi:hemoglobin/transferrin/lactoferrin receptor protein
MRPLVFRHLIRIGLLMGTWPTAAGQETSDAYEILPPLEVTAARIGQSLAEAPYSVNVIPSAVLEERSVRSLPEALAENPGVMVQKTANGQGSPYIRGFTGYRTLALIDGVRYNSSVYRDGPNEYFSLIDHHTLDRIELLQGPASVQYGSEAVGGTLQLFTRESSFQEEENGKTFAHGSQSYRWSSAEHSHVSRTTAETGVGGNWGLLLGFTRADFGDVDAANLGRQKKTGYDQYGFDARADWRISENWQLTLNHQNSAQDDVWRTHSTVFGESFSGTTVGTDLRRLKDLAHSLDYLKLTGADLHSAIDAATFTLSYQTWDENADRVKSDRSRQLESLDSRMWGADLQLESLIGENRLIYGADFYQERVDSARRDFLPDGSLDQIRIQGPVGDDSRYTLAGAYVQGIVPLGSRTEITAGTRITRAEADIGAFEDPATGASASFEDSWNDSVSSLRISHRPEETSPWMFWSGLSQAFRAPNLADLSRYGDSRSDETEIAATDLDPEEFLTWELGVKGEQGPFSATATAYWTFIDDYITSTPTGRIIGWQTEVTKRNSSNGDIIGLELTSQYRLHDQWTLNGNLTWLRGNLESPTDATSTQTSSEPLSRVQPLTANLALRWDSPERKWWGEFACTLASDADRLSRADAQDTQRIPPGGTPGYALLGLYAGYSPNEHFSAHVALENLLDQAYRVHGSGSNEPGFGLTTGITLSF